MVQKCHFEAKSSQNPWKSFKTHRYPQVFLIFMISPERRRRNTWIEESYFSISRLKISKIRFQVCSGVQSEECHSLMTRHQVLIKPQPKPNDQARNQAGSHRVATEEVLGKHGRCHPWWQAGCGGRGLQGSWRTNQGRECQEGRGSMRKCLLRSKIGIFELLEFLWTAMSLRSRWWF